MSDWDDDSNKCHLIHHEEHEGHEDIVAFTSCVLLKHLKDKAF